jgi:hypothetical protein
VIPKLIIGQGVGEGVKPGKTVGSKGIQEVNILKVDTVPGAESGKNGVFPRLEGQESGVRGGYVQGAVVSAGEGGKFQTEAGKGIGGGAGYDVPGRRRGQRRGKPALA